MSCTRISDVYTAATLPLHEFTVRRALEILTGELESMTEEGFEQISPDSFLFAAQLQAAIWGFQWLRNDPSNIDVTNWEDYSYLITNLLNIWSRHPSVDTFLEGSNGPIDTLRDILFDSVMDLCSDDVNADEGCTCPFTDDGDYGILARDEDLS